MEGFSNLIKSIFKYIIMKHSPTQKLDKKNTDLITIFKIEHNWGIGIEAARHSYKKWTKYLNYF